MSIYNTQMMSLEKRGTTASSVASLIFLFLSLLSNLCPASYAGDIEMAAKKDSFVVINQAPAELYISSEADIYGQEKLQNVKVLIISATENPISQPSKKISSKARIKRKSAIVKKVNPSSLSPDLPKYDPGQVFENSFLIPSAAVFVAQNQNPFKKYLNGTGSLVRSKAHKGRYCQMVCLAIYNKKAVQASRTLFVNRGPPFHT